ncbi:MAG: WD40 repeat domain-containing protein [Gemmataceae bacterium]
MMGRSAIRFATATTCLFACAIALVAQTTEIALIRKPIRRLGSSRFRHGSPIQCLAFSADGKRLYAGGGADPGRAWDVSSGKLLLSLDETWIGSILLPADGKTIITSDPFFGAKAWDPESGKPMAKLDSAPSNIRTAAISSQSGRIALGGSDGEVHIYLADSRRLVKNIKVHPEEITTLAYSEDGQLLTAGGDRSLRWWQPDGDPLKHVKMETVIHAIQPLNNGKCLAAGNSGKLLVADRDTGKVEAELPAHAHPVIALLFSTDKKTLVSCARNGEAVVWDWFNRKQLRKIQAGWGFGNAFALSPDGTLLAAAGASHRIKLFDAKTGSTLGETEDGISAPIAQAAMLEQGQTWIGITEDGNAVVWNLGDAKPTRTFAIAPSGEEQQSFSLAVAMKHKLALIASAASQKIQAWDPHQAKLAYEISLEGDSTVMSIAVSPQSDRLAVGYHSGSSELWDLTAKKKLFAWKLPTAIQALAFDRSGKTLAVGARTKVLIADAENGNELRRFDPRPDGPAKEQPLVASLAFLPDGRMLALGGYDGIVRLIDSGSAKEVQTYEGSHSAILAVSSGADGRTIAAACGSKSIRMWDLRRSEGICGARRHEGPAISVDFTPDCRTLVSAGSDGCFEFGMRQEWRRRGALPTLTLPQPDLQGRWQDLALVDANRGMRAAWSLVAAENSASFLSKQLYLVDPQKIKKLLADLNDSKFNVREKATTELERYGRWVEAGLREVADNPPGPEGKRRAERLLQKLNVPGAITLHQERLRQRRVLLVLEQIGNEVAVKSLSDLSTGAPEEDLRREAGETLVRVRSKKRD